LEDTFHNLDILVENPVVINKNTQAVYKLFKKSLNCSQYWENILLIDRNGRNIGAAIYPKETHKQNYASNEWFLDSRNGKHYYISKPYIFEFTKTNVFMLTYPVF
jgi:hypothetical protein